MLNTIDPILRTPLGGVFENAVLLNLLQGASAFKSVATWKKGKQAGIEVDFTVDVIDARTRIPVECKATTSIQKRHYKNIIHYLEVGIPFTHVTTRYSISYYLIFFQEIQDDKGKLSKEF